MGSKRIEAGFSRLRLKVEQEGKSNRGCCVHTLRHMSLFLCAIRLAHVHGQTCAKTLIRTGAVCVVLTVWWTAVCGSLCCARWEVAVAFSDLTTRRSIWLRQTHTEGQLQIAILAPSPLKANGIHPHRNRRLRPDIQPLSRWPCPSCTSPKPRGSWSSKPVTVTLWLLLRAAPKPAEGSS